ncbi:biotin--[acetyl-CoA-carboxylase] ligase [Belliella sp. DSM 107340]|uniref:Biotin--[acetyl-CoA-carboxylase] ligase n=1 Tax=Belliella calami TaxID=2923436 RepID=A0ABS9USE0_9BACT|nr:biotin--[acetyl-CoA-carboxylase] ligase [Belliella calami]MCH7399536.1 biotin--[acetyl-CoA-carboxylase] ligase [Belliella calami]
MYKILANTLFLGKDIISLPECHSTNDVAMEKIKSREAAEGTIVITEKQTKGKGQRGNVWESQEGKNLTFSLVLSPKFLQPMQQFDLNIAISIAIHELLSEYVSGLKIKWPNDIVHETDGKVGGILIENIIGQGCLEFSIAGIGLNINQRFFENLSATSLANLSGFDFDKWEIFKLLIHKIEINYLELKKGNLKKMYQYYLNNLFRYQEWASFSDSENFVGMIIGVQDDGRLIIQKEDGSQNYYAVKEVGFL